MPFLRCDPGRTPPPGGHLGKALSTQAFTDDTVGRVLDRLYDFGTMKLFTTW
jgi:hypothetical protein